MGSRAFSFLEDHVLFGMVAAIRIVLKVLNN
jgi:hypothetical protein